MTSNLYVSVTSRRGILMLRRGIRTSRRHFYTSRRGLVQVSVTSRRGPERRDVIWSLALSCRDVDPNVATWACLLSVTSRRHPARRDVTLFLAQEQFILALHLPHPLPETLAFLPSCTPALPSPARALCHAARRFVNCLPTDAVLPRVLLKHWLRVLVAFPPHCARV